MVFSLSVSDEDKKVEQLWLQWSYNSKEDVFVVSPDPDLHVFDLSVLKDRCLILATDGLWNVLSPGMAVMSAFDTEQV